MRSLSIFLLVTASQTGNAGSRRRNLGGLDWDLFSSAPDISASGQPDLGLEYGSTVPITDDYGSNLALFDTTASDTSDNENPDIWGSTDYTFALGGTGSDSGTDPTTLAENLDPTTYSASLPDLDLFGSEDISAAGCSGTTASGKVRRDKPMCATRGDDKAPTIDPPTIPFTKPDPPPLKPLGPNGDPPYIRFFEKPAPRIPNNVYDPRYPVVEEEKEDVQPSTTITGPCQFRFTYVCCELYGQLPEATSDNPVPECVQYQRGGLDPKCQNRANRLCCAYFSSIAGEARQCIADHSQWID